MGALNDPTEYYAPPQDDWALGDIVVVPTVVLWAEGERPADTFLPAPQPDGSTSVVSGLWHGRPEFADPVAEFWLSPAMIVADDCVLDKEFNRYVEQLMADGVSEEEALAIARADDALDPLVPVAPILPYHRLRLAGASGIRQAQTIGYFPVLDSDQMDEGFVDFVKIVPISRKLLRGPYAALSEKARNILRWKLAQYFAFRNVATDADLDSAVGRTITDIQVVEERKERRSILIILDDGESKIQLTQEPRRMAPLPGHKRGR